MTKIHCRLLPACAATTWYDSCATIFTPQLVLGILSKGKKIRVSGNSVCTSLQNGGLLLIFSVALHLLSSAVGVGGCCRVQIPSSDFPLKPAKPSILWFRWDMAHTCSSVFVKAKHIQIGFTISRRGRIRDVSLKALINADLYARLSFFTF